MAWEDRAYNRERNDYTGPRLVFPMPSKLTFALIISCVAMFFIENVTGKFGQYVGLYGVLTFDRGLAFTQPWRWITYQYLHASGSHLFFNLLFLYFLVPMLERQWGWKRTLGLYTIGGIAAGAVYGIMYLVRPSPGIVGASGCIFAVLGALTAIMPGMQILAAMVIPITIRTLTLLYTVLFLFTVIGDRNSSDAAHLGGLAFGFFATKFGMFTRHDSHLFGEDAHEFAAGEGGFEPASPRRRTSRWASKRAIKLAQAERAERERIDQILAKVSANGMQSLTWFERRALRKATEHQRQRDLELSRLRRS